MKKVFLGFALVAMAAVVFVNVSSAQEEGGGDPMQQYMEAIAPGPHHKAFEKRVGEWDAVIKLWAGPGAEPMMSEGKCTYEIVLGGRFLTQQMEGTIMGMPFVGMGISGFDKTKGKHTSFWIDSAGTASVYSEGECSDHCMKEWYETTTVDPLSGTKNEIKMVTLIKDENSHVFEWYTKMGEEYVKTMEIAYTRAGAK